MTNKALLINSDSIMNNYNEACLRLDSNICVKEATNRVFVVGHKFILPDLKKLAHSFDLKWNVCNKKYGRRITYNRADRQGSVTLRNFISITCVYDWSIRFRDITRYTNKKLDTVIITTVKGVYSNTCDPSYIDQFVLK